MELSYFEYWLTKEVWLGSQAVSFIVNYYMFQRSWEVSDDYESVREKFKSKLVNQLGSKELEHLFQKRTVIAGNYDEFDIFVSEKLDIDESDVIPKEFLMWLYSKNYNMPHDFKVSIGIGEKSIKLTEREHNTTTKNICQGIAKTLWDINPDMTITDMCLHPAIQNYGGGKSFDLETTLHRWLSGVDPRKNKTGPKKSIL